MDKKKIYASSGIAHIALFAVLAYTSISCISTVRMEKLLKEDGARAKLYSDILNNHRYLSQFIDSMQNNPHARMMLEERAFIQAMPGHSNMKMMTEQMVKKVVSDSVKTRQMCSMMIENKQVMKSMKEAIKQKEALEKGNERIRDPENHNDHD